MSRRKLIAGNWKMHGTRASAHVLVDAIVAAQTQARVEAIDVAVFPPNVYLAELVVRHSDSLLLFGAQDVSAHAHGAHTGETAAAMIKDIGATHTLIGHSERRQYHAESNHITAEKFAAAQAAGLIPILCVGETLLERERDETRAIIAAQIDAVLERSGVDAFRAAVVAYEPVWAIGTGLSATPAQAQEVHAFIRGRFVALDAIIGGSLRILYGGSVKPGNAAELFAQADIDGGLIGGASLVAQEFLAICAAA